MADNTTKVAVSVVSDRASADAIKRSISDAGVELAGAVRKAIREGVDLLRAEANELAESTGRRVKLSTKAPIHDDTLGVLTDRLGDLSIAADGRSRHHVAADLARERLRVFRASAQLEHMSPTSTYRGGLEHAIRAASDPHSREDEREAAFASAAELSAYGRHEAISQQRVRRHSKFVRRARAGVMRTGRMDPAIADAFRDAEAAQTPEEIAAAQHRLNQIQASTQEDRAASLEHIDRGTIRERQAALSDRLTDLSAVPQVYGRSHTEVFGTQSPLTSGLRAQIAAVTDAPSVTEQNKLLTQLTASIRAMEASARKFATGLDRSRQVAQLAKEVQDIAIKTDRTKAKALSTELDSLATRTQGMDERTLSGHAGSEAVKEAKRIRNEAREEARLHKLATAGEGGRRGLFGGAGVIMAGRRLGSGADQIAGSIFTPGGMAQMPGQIMRTGGGVLQDLGFARLASGRALGGVMALGGVALTALGSLAVAGVKHGYERSQMADDIYQDVEPFFARVQRDQALARGGAGEALRTRGEIDDEVFRRIVIGHSPPLSVSRWETGPRGRRRLVRDRGMIAAEMASWREQMAEDTPRGRRLRELTGRGAAERRVREHDLIEEEATRNLNQLGRLAEVSPSLAGRQRILAEYMQTAGVGGMTVGAAVNDLLGAHRVGQSRASAAMTARLEALTGQRGVNDYDVLGASLRMRGITGAPQQQAVAGFLSRQMGDLQEGFAPDAIRGRRFSQLLLGAGANDLDIGRIGGALGSMRSSNFQAIAGAPGQAAAQGLMLAEAFRGRSYEEAMEWIASTDPSQQMAEALARVDPSSSVGRMIGRSFSPANPESFFAALRPTQEAADAVADIDGSAQALSAAAFMRSTTAGIRENFLIGSQRNVVDKERIESFRAGLDEAAQALRRISDGVASGALGMF